MFDQLVDAATGSRAPAAVGAWARVENAACARRLAAIAEELERCPSPWSYDDEASGQSRLLPPNQF